MQINLETTPETTAGGSIPVKCALEFDDPQEVIWAGVKLVINNICKNELLVMKRDLVGAGQFEPGEYRRELALNVPPNIIPTIPQREVTYDLKLELRVPHFRNADEEMEISKPTPVEIKPTPVTKRDLDSHPVVLGIGGLNIKISKDVFKTGEAIKIDYEAEGYKTLQVRLMQNAGTICHRPQFGREYRQEEIRNPPVVANAARKDVSTGNGFILLKIPKVSEPSHEYFWTPKSEASWGHRYGDVSEWYLEIVGHKAFSSQKPVKFTIPIRLVAPQEKKRPPILQDQLFEAGSEQQASPLAGILQKKFKITEVALETGPARYRVTVENHLNKALEGVTITVTGMQAGLFEAPSWTVGFPRWESGAARTIEYPCKTEISAIVLNVEDNAGRKVRLTRPL